MKKSIVALLVIAAIVVLVSPGIIGRIAEESVDSNLQWAADESQGVTVTSERFDRGWFSSHGRHRVEIHNEELRAALAAFAGRDLAEGDPTLVIDTRIDHGLIPVTSVGRTEGSLAPGLGRGVSTLSIEFPDGEAVPVPGTIYSAIALDGALTANYILEPGSLQADGSTASWGNANIEISTDQQAQSFDFDGAIESLTLSDGNDALLLGETTFSGVQRPGRFNLSFGNFDMRASSVSVQENGTDTHQLGPVSVSASVDAAGLGRLVEKLEAADDEADPQQIQLLLRGEIENILAAGLELNVDRFDFGLPQGPVSLKTRFTVAESDGDGFDLTSLLMTLDAEADLTASAGFVDHAMAMNPDAGAIVGMGYLRKKGDVYEMRAEYAKGLLTINGAPMPIPLGGPPAATD